MITQFVPSNKVTKKVNDEMVEVEHASRYLYHDPQSVKLSKFISFFTYLELTKEQITEKIVRFFH